MSNCFVFSCLLTLTLFFFLSTVTLAWKSKECPIDSQDNRDSYLCIRPCEYEESDNSPSRSQHARKSDNFFVVFFPPKSATYDKERFKCPANFKQVNENSQCFCERPYTPYELEMQGREKCDYAFEQCRMYGSKPYDCNQIVQVCPLNLVKEYCLAGKVFKMRFSRVVYEFCHTFLRMPNDGRRHFIEPNIDRLKAKH